MSTAAATTLEATLPSSWYRSEDVFRLEKEHIFFREWICVGRDQDFPPPVNRVVIDVLGESVLLVRSRDQWRAFYNVCRHRGARLCPAAPAANGNQPALSTAAVAGRLMCPYHQWTYDLDGRLIAAPHLLGQPGFDKTAYSLYPIGVECWGGFIFLNLTPATAGTLDRQMNEISQRVQRYPLSELVIGHTIEYAVAANWKIVCENYNECYHCAGVHPELCAVVPAFKDRGGAGLDWLRGVPHRPGAYTFTSSGSTSRRVFPGLNPDEQVRHKGELLYPNLFLSLACDHVAAFILRPRNAGHTDITCHFLFEPFEIAKAGFDPSDVVEFWDLVNRQDWGICEMVQQGIGARVHEHGFYAPMEDSSLDIRRYVQDRIGEAVRNFHPSVTVP